MTKKKKQTPNDQGPLLECLKNQDYMEAWGIVKYIGYKIVADPNERFAIFNVIVEKFDYEMNNNFIKFYMDYLGYYKPVEDKYYFNNSTSVVKQLKQEFAIPSDKEDLTNIAKELSLWKNFIDD